MLLPHLASRLYGTPLLLARTKLDIILSVLGSRIDWPIQSELALPPPRASPSGQHMAATGIAVVPVHGSLVRRAIALDAASGLTSYGDIAAMLDAAAADPTVSGILLDIDSPGGEAGGVFELAQRIRAVDAIKPVWALACDSAFSAAYAIACAASRVFVTQTAGVGSIGVIAMHVDQSVRDAQEGYRFTAVSAGDFKNDLSPHEPIDKAALGRLQTEVDRLYGLFVDHVVSMRGMQAKTIRETQAGLFFGPDAVRCGLADSLASTDQVVSEFTAYLGARNVRGVASRVISAKALDVQSSASLVLQTNSKEIRMNPETKNDPAIADPDDATAEADQVQRKETAPSDTTVKSPSPTPSVAPLAPLAPLTPTVNDVAISAAVHSAKAEAVAQAISIAELCQLAGQSNRIATFLSQGLSASQVRQTLLASRAQSEEITSLIAPDASPKSAGATGDTGALMAAVKKLTQKI
jgi:signal peptide peptidase SppA